MPLSEEEMNPELQDDSSLQAYPLESTESVYRVPYTFPNDSDKSEFRFFEDGRQRTTQIGIIPTLFGQQQILLPVHYFLVAAVILQRHERQLTLWKQPLIRK